MAGYITIEEVREAVNDRTPDDNSIENDLFFSDEDILSAMRQCAAAYNSIAPIGIDRVSFRALPADTEVFMDGVIAQLYKTAINKLARNLISWQTGNTTVDLEKSRMESFSSLLKLHEQAFKEGAKERKMEINRNLAWGYF